MKKLWEKEKLQTPQWLIDFTVGNDASNDLLLAEFDVLGSIAHAKMLAATGFLSATELKEIISCLETILTDIKQNNFSIEEGVEDIHSQIELLLTQQLGETGKKIHTARSRNDQVLVDIKLFVKQELENISLKMEQLFNMLQDKSEEYKHILLPGYTHLQAAMPSSFGLWFGAYAEALCDDMELIVAAHQVANKNPLGSGAGYGSSLPIDRTVTTTELGFAEMNYNSVYAQMTRGKTEKIASMAIANLAATLGRFAMDVCIYNSQNFAFIKFPAHLTTGSSIMPHKKNPDVFELIRAKCNRLQALPNELSLLCTNLPSGYHRDLQLSKDILFPAFSTINDCISACLNMLKEIEINTELMNDNRYRDIFSVELVNEKVMAGVPFREAYKQTAVELEAGIHYTKPLKHTHQGSIGNLCNEEIRKQFLKAKSAIDKKI